MKRFIFEIDTKVIGGVCKCKYIYDILYIFKNNTNYSSLNDRCGGGFGFF